MVKEKINISWYNQYATAIKITVAMVVSAGATLWGVFRYVDNTSDHAIVVNESISSIIDDQKEILTGIDYLTRQLDSVNREITGIKDNMYLQGKELITLRKSYILYLKKNVEKTEQFMEYVDGLLDEKKKREREFEKARSRLDSMEVKIVVRKIEK